MCIVLEKWVYIARVANNWVEWDLSQVQIAIPPFEPPQETWALVLTSRNGRVNVINRAGNI